MLFNFAAPIRLGEHRLEEFLLGVCEIGIAGSGFHHPNSGFAE